MPTHFALHPLTLALGTCAGGFNSSLSCSASGDCPPGLFCDPRLQRCCPLVLPLIDANTAPQTVQAWKEELEQATGKSPANPRFSSRQRPCRRGSCSMYYKPSAWLSLTCMLWVRQLTRLQLWMPAFCCSSDVVVELCRLSSTSCCSADHRSSYVLRLSFQLTTLWHVFSFKLLNVNVN